MSSTDKSRLHSIDGSDSSLTYSYTCTTCEAWLTLNRERGSLHFDGKMLSHDEVEPHNCMALRLTIAFMLGARTGTRDRWEQAFTALCETDDVMKVISMLEAA